jgi:ribonuclease P protein component
VGTDLGSFDLTLLARRRPWASTPHLALTYLRSNATASAVVGAAANPVSNALILSVSKRLAPAAPLRNMVRRVLREAWRHQSWLEQSASLAVMIRLRALPLAALPTVSIVSTVSTGLIKGPVPKVSVKSLKGRAVLRIRRTDRALKAMIRAEADSLLEKLGRSMNLAGLER